MFKNRWWALGASFLGMIVGPRPLLVFFYAVLLRPATQELGVDRSIFSSAALLATMIGLIGGPTVGWQILRAQSLWQDLWRQLRLLQYREYPGALIGSLSFDHLHSYTPAFLLFAGALVVGCVLFLTLGVYAYPARHDTALPAGSAAPDYALA